MGIRKSFGADAARFRSEGHRLFFLEILRSWKYSVEKRGGRFFVATLPVRDLNLDKRIIENEFDTINLHDCFSNHVDYESNWSLYWLKNNNLDFRHDVQFESNDEKLARDGCIVERRLPGHAIASIRTGQYNDEGRIWETTIDRSSPPDSDEYE